MWVAGFLEELTASVFSSARMKEATYFPGMPDTSYDAIRCLTLKNMNYVTAAIENLRHYAALEPMFLFGKV
jgi:hypothetical protein